MGFCVHMDIDYGIWISCLLYEFKIRGSPAGFIPYLFLRPAPHSCWSVASFLMKQQFLVRSRIARIAPSVRAPQLRCV